MSNQFVVQMYICPEDACLEGHLVDIFKFKENVDVEYQFQYPSC